MEEEIKHQIELEVRRAISQEIGEHRNFLEKQAQLVIRGGGVLALLALGLFSFFAGKTWSDIADKMQVDIDNAVIEYRISESAARSLKERAEVTIDSIINSPNVRSKIDAAIEQAIHDHEMEMPNKAN